MINRESIVDIDIAKNSGIHRTHLNYSIGQTDDDFDIFGVRVFRNGEPVSLTGAQVSGYFLAPDGNAYTCTTGDVSGNVAYIRLDAVCYNVEGQFSLSIKLTGGGISGTVRIVDGTVMNSFEADATPAQPQDPTWAEILEAYTEASSLNEELMDAAGDFDNLAAVPVNLPNLLEGTLWTNGYIDSSGVIHNNESDLRHYSGLIEIVHPNEYQVVFTPEENAGYVQIHGYDAEGNFVRRFTSINNTIAEFGTRKSYKFTGGDCKYMRISIYKSYTGVWVGQPIEDRISSGDYQNEITMRGNTRRKDLFEGVGWTQYKQIGDDGEPIGRGDEGATAKTPYYSCSDLIEVIPHKRYFLTCYYRADRGENDITVDGYDAEGAWVKRLRTFAASEQTAGTMHLWDFNTEGCEQIRVSAVNYMQYALTAYDELEETVMQSLFDVHQMDFEVGGINFNTGVTTTTATRIRTKSYGDLSAEFIRAENAEICLFLYNRNGAGNNNSFRGVWDGKKTVYNETHWFSFIDLREVYNRYAAESPNLLYKLTVRIPGNNEPTAADGAKVYFYSREITYSTVGVYLNWAVIGSSSDAGCLGNDPNHEHYDIAWPNILARRLGNTVTNYSKWGLKLATFISSGALATVTAAAAKELYVLTLGGNDAADDTFPMGSMSNVNDTPPAAGQPCSTVYGCYGYIMKQLMAAFPDAKFILTTPPGANYSDRQLAVDSCVREMAAYFHVPYVEWESDGFMRSNVFIKNQVGNHPTKPMYGGKAMAFERLFSRCFAENISYFA